jgi:dihydrofolate synthase/folylpolyglutamate synthase
MTYEQAEQYLDSLIDFEKLGAAYFGRDRFQLANVRALLDGLGRPQDALKIVHIAGTKGKGSTAAMLDAILRASGCTVGLFTQPHLIDIRERTRLGGRMIPKRDFAAAVATARPLVEQINSDRQQSDITFYEAHLAIALLYFSEQQAEIGIMETGLGGRLDATNALDPVVCAITRIDYDHTDLLGDRLEDIAREKAGILKRNVPCVVAPQVPEVMAVLEEQATQVGAPLIPSPTVAVHDGSNTFTVRARQTYDELALPLAGAHQRENAALAIGLAERLAERLADNGPEVTADAVRRGLAHVRWPGRFQVIEGAPTIVLDVAHNPVSAQVLRQGLETLLARDPEPARLLLVVGMPRDKDIPAFARIMFPLADRVFCTRAESSRAAEPERLCEAGRNLAAELIPVPTVPQALGQACRAARPHDVVCVTGSFHVVGEAMVELDIPA